MAGPKTPPSMPRCPLCRPTWWWTPEVSIGEKWWKIMENRVKMLIHIHSYQIHIYSFSDLGSSVDLSEWSNFIQFTQLFPLPGAAETEGTGKSWGPSRQLAMPRILPKMEMSQVHFSVQEHLFWSKEIRISFHGGSSNPKRKPSLLQNHGFCARIGITLPQNGSNTAFYLGKWGFYVSDHEVNQNDYSESQSKSVSVLKISARIFPSTRRLIWSIMILYASICILFVWKSYHHFSLCRCHVRALKPSERSPSRHVLQIDQIFSGVVFLLLHLLQGIGHVFHPTLVQG